MQTEETDVVIVGAGIAGLCFAVEVFRRGLRAHVIERGPGGFRAEDGVLLQPPALSRLGALEIYDPLRSAGAPIERLCVRKAGTTADGLTLDYTQVGPPFRHALGVPSAAVERACVEAFTRFKAIRVDYRTELLSLNRARGRVAGVVARGPSGDITYTAKLVAVTTGSGGAPIRAEVGAKTALSHYPESRLTLGLERPEGLGDELSLWLGNGAGVLAFPLSRRLLRVEIVTATAALKAALSQGPAGIRELAVGIAPALEGPLKSLADVAGLELAPLRRARVSSWVQDGVALLGPAAGETSPLGLSGDTRSLLDAAALARVISNSAFTGDYSRLAMLDYESSRRAAFDPVADLAHDVHQLATARSGVHGYARERALARLGAAPALATKVTRILAGYADAPLTLSERLALAGLLPLPSRPPDVRAD